jgi:uncharacterized protein YjiS (DUF1127 family)
MHTDNCTSTIASPPAPASRALAGFVHRLPSPADVLRNGLRDIWRTLLRWQRRYNDRLRLVAMDDRLLGDIGISREQAAVETQKPFWRG